MKNSILVAAAVSVVLVGTTGCALNRNSRNNDNSLVISGKSANPGPTKKAAPTPMEVLQNPPSKATSGVTDLRRQLLTSTAKTLGFRGGVAARAQELVTAIRGRSDSLDSIFSFSPLIAPNGTLPPVIVEARDLSSFGPDQIRTATRAYKIEREERFVSVPPTWRDYLLVGLDLGTTVELPTFEARPQDKREQSVWADAVQVGWDDGRKEAERILASNFKRLTRDYTGMLLYSTLLQQGMVSNTRVAESQQAVTGSKRELLLGDSLKRVTERAGFEPNPNKWSPTITKGKPEDPTLTATVAGDKKKKKQP